MCHVAGQKVPEALREVENGPGLTSSSSSMISPECIVPPKKLSDSLERREFGEWSRSEAVVEGSEVGSVGGGRAMGMVCVREISGSWMRS